MCERNGPSPERATGLIHRRPCSVIRYYLADTFQGDYTSYGCAPVASRTLIMRSECGNTIHLQRNNLPVISLTSTYKYVAGIAMLC